jgi:hypothetical protein
MGRQHTQASPRLIEAFADVPVRETVSHYAVAPARTPRTTRRRDNAAAATTRRRDNHLLRTAEIAAASSGGPDAVLRSSWGDGHPDEATPTPPGDPSASEDWGPGEHGAAPLGVRNFWLPPVTRHKLRTPFAAKRGVSLAGDPVAPQQRRSFVNEMRSTPRRTQKAEVCRREVADTKACIKRGEMQVRFRRTFCSSFWPLLAQFLLMFYRRPPRPSSTILSSSTHAPRPFGRCAQWSFTRSD